MRLVDTVGWWLVPETGQTLGCVRQLELVNTFEETIAASRPSANIFRNLTLREFGTSISQRPAPVSYVLIHVIATYNEELIPLSTSITTDRTTAGVSQRAARIVRVTGVQWTGVEVEFTIVATVGLGRYFEVATGVFSAQPYGTGGK